MSLMVFAGASFASLWTQSLTDTLRSSTFYLGWGMAYAWLALARMTMGWIGERRVAWHWPVIGGMAGVVCATFFATAIVLYLPCALLGVYLCYFHLAGRRPPASE